MSGSNPRFPPGELSNMKPKSGRNQSKRYLLYLKEVWTCGYLHTLSTNEKGKNRLRLKTKTRVTSHWESFELTNMNDVSCSIQHDIAIVSVLDLQQEAHQGICCHGFNKVGPCLLESMRIFIPIHTDEILKHPSICAAAQLVPRLSIGNTLNHTTLKQRINFSQIIISMKQHMLQ